MPYIDFAEIKRTISIEQAMVYLALKGLKPENDTYRGECPRCKEGGSRAMVITPEKNAFYCHAKKCGGDVISLVAHLHGTGMKEAAAFLQERHSTKKATVPQKNERVEKKEPSGDFQPLSHLVFDHELVQGLGINAPDAEHLGIGFTSRGVLKGYVCIPVRDADGFLNGYVGIKEGKTPKAWHFPASNVIPLKRA